MSRITSTIFLSTSFASTTTQTRRCCPDRAATSDSVQCVNRQRLHKRVRHRPCRPRREYLDEEQWRTNWLERMRGEACPDHFYSDISELKNNFFRKYDPKINPMGLILLSHHGGGEIADTDTQTDPDRLINSSDIKRDFGAGSFAILASCSVGAMDEKHQDNSLFLHSLNESTLMLPL